MTKSLQVWVCTLYHLIKISAVVNFQPPHSPLLLLKEGSRLLKCLMHCFRPSEQGSCQFYNDLPLISGKCAKVLFIPHLHPETQSWNEQELDLTLKFPKWEKYLQKLNQIKADLCASCKEDQLCSIIHCCSTDIGKTKWQASQPTNRQITCLPPMKYSIWC